MKINMVMNSIKQLTNVLISTEITILNNYITKNEETFNLNMFLIPIMTIMVPTYLISYMFYYPKLIIAVLMNK